MGDLVNWLVVSVCFIFFSGFPLLFCWSIAMISTDFHLWLQGPPTAKQEYPQGTFALDSRDLSLELVAQ